MERPSLAPALNISVRHGFCVFAGPPAEGNECCAGASAMQMQAVRGSSRMALPRGEETKRGGDGKKLNNKKLESPRIE